MSAIQDLVLKQINNELLRVHTQIIVKVASVDYKRSLVSVLPLQSTTVSNFDREMYSPVIEEVPIYTNSSTRGKAFLTFPVKVGDVGVLVMSERDTQNYLDTDGNNVVDTKSSNILGVNGTPNTIYFVNGLYTSINNFKTDSNNVVLRNEISVSSLAPDGEVKTSNENGQMLLLPDGTQFYTNNSDVIELKNGTININTSGSVTINGATVTSGGNVITKNGTDLDQLKADFDAHLHSDVTSGTSNTGGIIV